MQSGRAMRRLIGCRVKCTRLAQALQSRRVLLRTIFLILSGLILLPGSAQAYCRFTSVSPVGFGAYNVFSKLPNNSGIGSVTIDCNGFGAPNMAVALGTGQSGTYSFRAMNNGANRLIYNIYTSASRTIIWGDGSGGSSALFVLQNGATLSLFGQIPEGQDAGVGIYTDTITVTVNF